MLGSLIHGAQQVTLPSEQYSGHVLNHVPVTVKALANIAHEWWSCAAEPWFIYPEVSPSSNYYLSSIAAPPSLGIAVTGGGYRAATLALGYVR